MHFERLSNCLVEPFFEISQNGILELYHNGIIMSREFLKKGERNGISAQRIAKKEENIAA